LFGLYVQVHKKVRADRQAVRKEEKPQECISHTISHAIKPTKQTIAKHGLGFGGIVVDQQWCVLLFQAQTRQN